MTGVDVDPYHVPIDEAREEFGEEFAEMFRWFNEEGYHADIDAGGGVRRRPDGPEDVPARTRLGGESQPRHDARLGEGDGLTGK